MARTQQQIVLELKQLRTRGRNAPNDEAAQNARDGIDRVLDELLEQKGAHRPECRCHECWETIRPHLDPQSLADPHEWGGVG